MMRVSIGRDQQEDRHADKIQRTRESLEGLVQCPACLAMRVFRDVMCWNCKVEPC
jgi:hypothetical protein